MHAVIPFPDISPEVFPWPVFGFVLPLRWYALAYIAGILLGWRIIVRLAARPDLWRAPAPYTARQAEDWLTWAILGIILGGRLGFVLFYQPGYYLTHPLEIVKVWQGGMSFHGGFLGVLLAMVLFTRLEHIRLSALTDAMAAVTPIGLCLGRIANFINAELWGRPSTLPWAVIFPGEAAQDCGPDWVGPCARHPSQLYEAGLEGIVLGLLMWLAVRRGALGRPWLASGLFLAGYGVARFAVEFFRLADPQYITPENPFGHVLGGPVWGLTMGQALSLPMVLAGTALILMALRRPRAVPA